VAERASDERSYGIVVVGGGVTAAKAVVTLRDEGYDGPVTVLAGEPLLPYDRPPLSKQVLTGEASPDSTTLLDQEWYAEHEVDLRLGVEARRLVPDRYQVVTADGRDLPYSKLLLATGSRVRTLPVPGADLDGVVTLRTLEDSVRMRDRFADRPDVVVVGAGWIGLEAAAAARAHGAQVTVVSPEAPLVRVLGDQLSDVFAGLHRDNGVDLRVGPGIDSFRGDQRVEAVVTSDGQMISADLVVVGVGVAPCVELAENAGLHIDNDTGGVFVDASLRTSRSDVYAAGDVASWPCAALGGRRIRVEHWANAHDGGVTAAKAMLDPQVSHDVLPFFFSDQYDAGMEYAGHVASVAEAQLVVRGELATREFVALWCVDGRVEAGMHLNVWDTIDDVQALIRSRRQLDPGRLADTSIALSDI